VPAVCEIKALIHDAMEMARQSQNLTHWSVLSGGESLATSRGPNRFQAQKNGLGIDSGC
jgi:hypothetical protein